MEMDQALLFWIIACVIFTLIEAFTQQFVSIWFLSGGIVALIASVIGVSMDMQLGLFLLVSFVTLVAFRPFVKKYVQGQIFATNTDMNVGQRALVTKDFDETTLEGRVLVNDMDWAAKSIDEHAYKKGETVLVEEIKGVKCLVRSTNEF